MSTLCKTSLNEITQYLYDGDGDVTEQIDPLGQMTTYAYNLLGQVTQEKWFTNTSSTTPTDTLDYTYDNIGDLLTAGDANSSYTFAYNALGQQTSVDNAGTAGMPHVVLTSAYNANGNRTGLNSTIGGTADFQNAYSYDAYGNENGVIQQGVTGGDAVAVKHVTFAHNADNLLTSMSRYASTSTSNLVVSSTYGYDHDGNLTSLVHNNSPTTFADYTWTYDLGGRVLTLANSQHSAEDLTYSYDDDNQLLGASGTSGESYAYDPNGNRTSADNTNGSHTYGTPSNNQITDDGTNTYQYDADGNLIKSTSDATSSYTVYAYDNRNRLISATDYTSGDVQTQQVTYTYDVFNNLVGRSFQYGAGTTVTHQQFVYDDPADNGQMVLAFATTGSTTPTAANLTDRYLWGQAVDQILADEKATGVGWLLTDNQGTVRDAARYSAGTTSVVDHITYNSYGQPLSHSATDPAGVDAVFGYTGKFYDGVTKLQWNVNRWYNPETGTWMSQDPIGFAGGQANLSEYVGNDPLNATDPHGLADQKDEPGWKEWFKSWLPTFIFATPDMIGVPQPLPIGEIAGGLDAIGEMCQKRNAIRLATYWRDHEERGSKKWKEYDILLQRIINRGPGR